ncbi:carbon-nitrogen hydrolase [Myxozyma melibiosi]|uniref:Carbon-nitrogen hydrolase n=1 Tax=Myxozyma melibiosi TaxID=54550 RepID=A0ABR1FD87_9ASCO
MQAGAASRRRLTVACLQLNTHHGTDVLASMTRADALLSAFMASKKGRSLAAATTPAIVVLPELAFTGYAFPSPAAIAPYLEPTADGRTTRWAQDTARRIGCHVVVGYPERANEKVYNSAVIVSPAGMVLHNYRKHFLYEADEKWGASPGPDGFLSFDLTLSKTPAAATDPLEFTVRVAVGICMDLNPEKFEAPFRKYEFANFCVSEKAELILAPMAWLSSSSGEEKKDESPQVGRRPEWSTLQYWATRLTPVSLQFSQQQQQQHGEVNTSVENKEEKTKIAFVAANRCGVEDNKTVYAGSSCALTFDDSGKVRLVDALARDEEGVISFDIELD